VRAELPVQEWRVADGTLHVYRLFDIADALDLARAEQLLAAPRARLRLEGAQSSTAMEFPRPPLQVALGPRSLPLSSGPRDAEVSAKLYDYGVASIQYRVDIPGGTALVDLVALAEELVAQPTPALDAAARREAARLATRRSAA
jgi:hypothetical protein